MIGVKWLRSQLANVIDGPVREVVALFCKGARRREAVESELLTVVRGALGKREGYWDESELLLGIWLIEYEGATVERFALWVEDLVIVGLKDAARQGQWSAQASGNRGPGAPWHKEVLLLEEGYAAVIRESEHCQPEEAWTDDTEKGVQAVAVKAKSTSSQDSGVQKKYQISQLPALPVQFALAESLQEQTTDPEEGVLAWVADTQEEIDFVGQPFAGENDQVCRDCSYYSREQWQVRCAVNPGGPPESDRCPDKNPEPKLAASLVMEKLNSYFYPYRGEEQSKEYKTVRLGAVLFESGFRCDVHLADGGVRRGAVGLHWPHQAIEWGERMVDTGRIFGNTGERRCFQDEEAQVRRLLVLADQMVDRYFPKANELHVLILKFLLIKFEQVGMINLWDEYLRKVFNLSPVQMGQRLKALERSGLLWYKRWPNRSCPPTHCLGPAWLTNGEEALNESELAAIVYGGNYREGSNPFPPNAHFYEPADLEWFQWHLIHRGDSLWYSPKAESGKTWQSRWSDGVWVHEEHRMPSVV